MSAPATPSPIGSVRDQLQLAACAGLVTGLGEAAVFALRRFLLGRLIFQPTDAIWMAPLADLLTFLALGIVLLLVARASRGRIGLPFAFGCYAAVGVFTWSLQYGPLAHIAAALLAAGVGVQAARWAGRRPARLRWAAAHGVVPLLGVVLLLGAGLSSVRAIRARAAMPRTPAPADAPNVLLIILDTVRSLDLSVYGYDRPTTPGLEQFARDGVRFAHAISPAPWTLPAHASMFTGHWPHELSASWLRPLDGAWPTVAEVFARHGWVTAGIVANTQYAGRQSGLARGFEYYRDYPVTVTQVLLSSAINRYILHSRYRERELLRVRAADVNRAFLRWLDRPRGGRPFFAFLNYMDAHDPYQPPPPYAGRFSRPGDLARIAVLKDDTPARRWSPEVIHAAIAAYDESILALDARLQELFDALRQRGLLDRTLVVVTSDHGEEFGEHGVFFHGNSLYRPSVQVPLLLRWPGAIPAGRVVSAPVTTRDLAITLTDLAGIHDQPFPGHSLARSWGAGSPAAASDTLLSEVDWSPRLPRHTPVSRGNMRSVVLDGGRLILNGDRRVELYDFDADPGERNDLAGDPGRRDQVTRLEAALRATGAVGAAQ